MADKNPNSGGDKLNENKSSSIRRAKKITLIKWKSLNVVPVDNDLKNSTNLCCSPPLKDPYDDQIPLMATQNSQNVHSRLDKSMYDISPSTLLGSTGRKKKRLILPPTNNASRKKNLGRHNSMEEMRTILSAIFAKDDNKVRGKSSSYPPTSQKSKSSVAQSTSAKQDQKGTSTEKDKLNTSNQFPDDGWDDELIMASQTVEEKWKNAGLASNNKGKEVIVETPKKTSSRRKSKPDIYRQQQPQNGHRPAIPETRSCSPTKRKLTPSLPSKGSTSKAAYFDTSLTESEFESIFESSQ